MNWVSIDFGTSYSAAAVLVKDEPVKVVPLGNSYGKEIFPTVAYVNENNEISVCNEALMWLSSLPERFIKNFKQDIHEGVISGLNVSYKDIVVAILKKIKESAEQTIGGNPITATLLTIPASYSEGDPRIDVMREAAQNTGFETIEFLSEPEAAAIYYDSIQQKEQGSITLIYDLGGGTFDPALIEHGKGHYRILGHSSGIECGGKYFDSALYEYIQQKEHIEFSDNDNLMVEQSVNLLELCQKIKEELSAVDKLSYPFKLSPGKIITINIKRTEFEDLISPILEKTFEECQSLISSAGKQWSDVNRILLVGGSATIPCVKTLFEKYLTGHNAQIPIIQNVSNENIKIDPLFAVSLGGIIYKKNKNNIDNNALKENIVIEDKKDTFLNNIHDVEFCKKQATECAKKGERTQAVYWLTRAAQQGDAEVQYCLGLYYEKTKDDEQAVYWYTKAAEQGDTEAQYCLGLYYEETKDDEQAVYWYTKAAEQGDTEAQCKLGLCYYNGIGVAKDEEQAAYWYTKAAEQGVTEAQCKLGLCYYNGEGVTKDYKQAVYWYKRAAQRGHAEAQYYLGLCYENGEGVMLKDYRMAMDWYKKAAEKGYAPAQNNLGACYYNGNGVTQDYKQAVYWYKKAANQGFAQAQYMLGSCYENGEGVMLKDYRMAIDWYKKAAEKGYDKTTVKDSIERCKAKQAGVDIIW